MLLSSLSCFGTTPIELVLGSKRGFGVKMVFIHWKEAPK
jgi:hypothetical protein